MILAADVQQPSAAVEAARGGPVGQVRLQAMGVVFPGPGLFWALTLLGLLL